MRAEVALAHHRVAPWRGALISLGAVAAALLLLAAGDWAAMADQWWNSSTYNHILFIPLIIAWLVQLRREELSRLEPRSWWPGLLFLAGALFLWVLGRFAGVNLVSQFAAVAMLVAVVPLMLGPRVTAGLAFPLAYALFLVPFGDELVPALQTITAKIVIALTHLSGVDAVIEGVFIDTPAGLFEVAEACSGVKFLVAMIALGVLVAHVCFVSWRRRALFMAAAILLPIIANAVRAWGTIYIAQFAGVEFAAGFDHIFYGWIFFALVVALLLAVAWRWFDRDPDEVPISAERLTDNRMLDRLATARMGIVPAALSAAALALAAGGWLAAGSNLAAPLPQQLRAPVAAGWMLIDQPQLLDWHPRAAGADRRLAVRYRHEDGAIVDLFVAAYAAQGEGREAGAMGEGALVPDTEWRWLERGAQTPAYSADRLFALGSIRRLAQTSYVHGDLVTGSAARLRLATLTDRVTLRAEPTLMVILSAEQGPGLTQEPEAALAAFRRDAGAEALSAERLLGERLAR